MNQDESLSMLDDTGIQGTRKRADDEISSTYQLLQELGIAKPEIPRNAQEERLNINRRKYSDIADEAASKYRTVELEDILSESEIQNAIRDLSRIEQEFSQKTSIRNKQDLIFLSIATALQTVKALLFPVISQKLDYGNGFDPAQRTPHDDKEIKRQHDNANRNFRDKYSKRYAKGYWVEMLFQPVPYDAIKGSADLGLGMSGNNHRLKTLGHDPILGWLFGTANILTDTVTLLDFSSYRVQRKPQFKIMPEIVLPHTLISDTIQMIKNDRMNLPAALFAQAQHLKSDVYTKRGLPVPVLGTIDSDFAGKLYDEHYDALCFARDSKIVAGSAAISAIINMIISLAHGLWYDEKSGMSRELYEVRTRKILLISNSIASSSNIIYSAITKNPKALDIGGLFTTISRLFSDIRFIARVRQEYIDTTLDRQMKQQINELNEIERRLTT